MSHHYDEYPSDITTIPVAPEAELLSRARSRIRRLRKALRIARGIFWMAERYAESGGSDGPEMREYLATCNALDDLEKP